MELSLFFVFHWYLSALVQSLFLHRYSSHGQYQLTRLEEKIGYVLTFLIQGPGYLSPIVYAKLHQAHHAFSDQVKDPHSPSQTRSLWNMIVSTSWHYRQLRYQRHPYAETFTPFAHNWETFDKIGQSWATRTLWILVYIGVYILLSPHWAFFLLLPIHILMGPIHGLIVNWCGHKYGYRNYASLKDQSKNSLPIDILVVGELYQNNHHHSPLRKNFAHKWFEFDLGHFFLTAYLNSRKTIQNRFT